MKVCDHKLKTTTRNKASAKRQALTFSWTFFDIRDAILLSCSESKYSNDTMTNAYYTYKTSSYSHTSHLILLSRTLHSKQPFLLYMRPFQGGETYMLTPSTHIWSIRFTILQVALPTVPYQPYLVYTPWIVHGSEHLQGLAVLSGNWCKHIHTSLIHTHVCKYAKTQITY